MGNNNSSCLNISKLKNITLSLAVKISDIYNYCIYICKDICKDSTKVYIVYIYVKIAQKYIFKHFLKL